MDIDHYIEKCKEHESKRTSTFDRNVYWKQWQERQQYAPRSNSRYEHG